MLLIGVGKLGSGLRPSPVSIVETFLSSRNRHRCLSHFRSGCRKSAPKNTLLLYRLTLVTGPPAGVFRGNVMARLTGSIA
jgi:hypothetical protein